MLAPYERLFLTGVGVADDRVPSRSGYLFIRLPSPASPDLAICRLRNPSSGSSNSSVGFPNWAAHGSIHTEQAAKTA